MNSRSTMDEEGEGDDENGSMHSDDGDCRDRMNRADRILARQDDLYSSWEY